MDLISDWRAAMGSRYQEAAVAAFWDAVESGAEELDAMAAGLRAHADARAAWVDRLCREREKRVRQPVQHDDWTRRILVARDRRRKRREPATRRRWAIMMRPRVGCELVPPPWWGMLSGREPPPYDAGEDWGVLCLP